MATKRSPDELPQPKNNLWDFIAYYLRFQRNQRGLSGEALGRIIQAGKSQVSRIETGEERLDGTQAALLDKAWNTGGLFSILVWYASIGHDPQWFAQYLKLEERASMIRLYASQLIHGLLQTEDYAGALIAGGHSPTPDEDLHERLARQAVFSRPKPPYVAALLSQASLEWPVGTPEIMRGQLQHLVDLSEQPDVTIRLVPRTWNVGAHVGLQGSFQLMSGTDFGEVAFSESPGGGRLVSCPPDVVNYAVWYDRISAKALPEEPSRDLVRSLMEELR
ncbi:helix-turn-helix domain-containing protein [Actinomadura rubrisoli]|uniref:XRE family transcriptional regulator n=1 Tax=Actinomadura rubrisoli TaxID=2530368 RepID=A0A4V2YQU7_9ACTN|nr:helix-turn-helix transcriptional regulator [Actinomadura rubrisoli]TDD63567.1 XRE family transcriptional regulator [Actinomadura rubrisoli]